MRQPLFVNGRRYAFWASNQMPFVWIVPWVRVQMKCYHFGGQIQGGGFKVVNGEVDTGATRTVLSVPTALTLGIWSFTAGRKLPLKTATDQPTIGYLHSILVLLEGRRPDGSARNVIFSLEAVVCPNVKRNLFGRDWLRHVCIAMDHKSPHFLAG